MPGHSYEEIVLKGKKLTKYRLAIRFEDPQYGPLALFLNSEAGVFGAEIAEALEQARAAMGQTEFTGNLCTAVISPESVIVYRNTEDEDADEDEKGREDGPEAEKETAPRVCEIPAEEFAEILAEWREKAAEVKKKNVAERRKAALRRNAGAKD